MPPFAGTGPRHLVLNYGNDIFVLPQAVNLVKRPAPGNTSVRTNGDGSVTVSGTNFGGDSVVYFDGIQAARTNAFAGNDGELATVLPPPGTSGQVAITVYNDGRIPLLDHWAVADLHLSSFGPRRFRLSPPRCSGATG
jgi:hypothetical protein